MSEFGDMTIQVRRVAEDPETDQAAVRAVMLRVDRGQLDHPGAYRVLEALGLIDAPSGGKYTPWGARNTKDRDRKRAEEPVERLAHPDPPVAHETAAEAPGEVKTGHRGCEAPR